MDKNKRKREEEEWGSSLQSYRDQIENQDQKKKKREEEEWGSTLQSYIDQYLPLNEKKRKRQEEEGVSSGLQKDWGKEEERLRRVSEVLMEDICDEDKLDRNSNLEGEEAEIDSIMIEEEKIVQGSGIIETIYDLNFNYDTVEALEKWGFISLTQIQARCIPPLLEGKDVVGVSSSGSGKTLAFLLPAIEAIQDMNSFTVGTSVIIICPTNILALQTYYLAMRVGRRCAIGLCVDGMPRRDETDFFERGVGLLIATPGRLLFHLQRTKNFVYNNLKFLIVDEADRLLESIFEEDMKKIMELLPKERQTALFSATPPTKNDLARVSFKNTHVYIDVDEGRSMSTAEGLQQGYCIVPSEMRFCLLYAFLKRNLSKKVVVLFSSCAAVMYYSKLLRCIHVDCFGIHGKQNLQKQASSLKHFRYKKEGVLLCTGVAACGLDFFEVDWVVQYDPSDNSKEYIRNVGLTARGEGGKGDSLLFLTPEEFPIIQYLMDSNISLKEYKFDRKKLANLQPHLNYLVEKKNLKKLAEKAYKSYIKAYESYSKKYIFNVKLLSPRSVAASFCLDHPPKINYST